MLDHRQWRNLVTRFSAEVAVPRARWGFVKVTAVVHADECWNVVNTSTRYGRGQVERRLKPTSPDITTSYNAGKNTLLSDRVPAAQNRVLSHNGITAGRHFLQALFVFEELVLD